MENKSYYMRASEVADALEISESHAYKIMRMLNNELKEKGMIVVSGRVSRRYFEERLGIIDTDMEQKGASNAGL